MYMYEEQNNKSTFKSTIIILHVQRLWYNNDEPTFMKRLMLHALISMIHGLIDVYYMYIKHQRLQLT